MPQVKWTQEAIKKGIDRFLNENGYLPTARDYDQVDYLPTARQVQRAFGGMSTLRELLGYGKIDYTKGALRSTIATNAGIRGIEAEEMLEVLLTKRFGEPYVHTQKRYIRGGKSRYDFFVYANRVSFGVDVFATTRLEYITNNVRHKIPKYADTSLSLPIYFVVHGKDFEQWQVNDVAASIKQLETLPNIKVLTLATFLELIQTIRPLSIPDNYVPVVENIEHI